MKFLRVLFVLPLLLLLYSCANRTEENADVLPYLKDAMSDRNSRESLLLGRSTVVDTQGDITLLGRTESAELFASRFLEYDEHDNVDGRRKSDNLKDFAGETLSCISESFQAIDLSDSVSVELFRTNAVKSMISALDTLSYVSLYDSYGLGRKNTTKIFLLVSPEHSLWTAGDAEYMVKNSGATFRTLSPLNECFNKLFSLKKGKPLRLGIICRQNSGALPELYEELFRRNAEEFGMNDASCMIINSGTDSLLYRLLRAYDDTGDPRPLDAVLVDDFSLDIDELRLQQAEMVSIMNESSLTFGRMLSEDFDIYDTFEQAVTSLYAVLRQNNLFTHNISQPEIQYFSPVLRSDESGDSVILIPVSYVQN